MSVREMAIRDIKDDLRQSGKCFIAFVKKLNPVMDELVNEQLEAQSNISRV